MVISYIVYFMMVLCIFWAYCGYVLALYCLIIIGANKSRASKLVEFPHVTILVPCYNEAPFVEDKINNLLELDYPPDRFDVIFVDGKSSDQTYERLTAALKHNGSMSAIQANQKGKINQLNFALAKAKGEIIVNSDMDCLLEKDCLKELIKEFQADGRVSLVGAYVVPRSTLFFEEKYWSDQNRLRVLESRAHSSSIVIAPCYAFKRDLLESFPEDCIADDVYISFHANLKGRRSRYCASALAHETRSPDHLTALLVHKFRKGNAYITEILRFIYKLPAMHPAWKLIFMTKFVQVVLVPWIIPFFALSCLALSMSGEVSSWIVVGSLLFLFLTFLITHFLLAAGPGQQSKRRSFLAVISVFVVANMILLLNGILFPFYRQNSNYGRIKNKGDQ